GGEVEVGAVRDALKLAPLATCEPEAVLDVGGLLRVVRQLFLRMVVEPEVVALDAEVDVPVEASLHPVLLPLVVGAGLNEELHFHLLELARAEDEVAGRSEEHTSELQSRENLVCRLLLEKKKTRTTET